MRTELEPQDIEAVAQRVAEIIVPALPRATKVNNMSVPFQTVFIEF